MCISQKGGRRMIYYSILEAGKLNRSVATIKALKTGTFGQNGPVRWGLHTIVDVVFPCRICLDQSPRE